VVAGAMSAPEAGPAGEPLTGAARLYLVLLPVGHLVVVPLGGTVGTAAALARDGLLAAGVVAEGTARLGGAQRARAPAARNRSARAGRTYRSRRLSRGPREPRCGGCASGCGQAPCRAPVLSAYLASHGLLDVFRLSVSLERAGGGEGGASA